VTAILLKLALGGFNLLKVIGAALKRFFAALNVQGWIGLIASAALAFMWLQSAGDARHWKKQSASYQGLYALEHAAFGQTVLNYRAAAEKARQADAANKARVEAEQAAINERTSHDYEARLAAARAAAERLRSAAAATHPGSRGTAPVPGVSAPAAGIAQAPGNGLPVDTALICTEQAIQLDELSSWVIRQHAVDPNKEPTP
jgi:hypothetical protein